MSITTPTYQFVADSAQELYRSVLDVLRDSEEVSSVIDRNSIGSAWGQRERETREIRFATLFLTNPCNRIISSPFITLERIVPRTILSTLSDEIDVDILAYYDSKAREFSDDGKTLMTNYGFRIRHWNGIDQIQQVITQFKKDPHTRRAVIHIHAGEDFDKKYDPCINSLHFLIRNNSLECHSFWRSENGLTLLPVNIFEFSMLQELIASELGISPGLYAHTVTSLHYYVEDKEKLIKSLDSLRYEPFPNIMPPMPKDSLMQLDLVRKYERKWRLSPSVPKSYDEKCVLSEYWKKMADVMRSAIEKRQAGQPL